MGFQKSVLALVIAMVAGGVAAEPDRAAIQERVKSINATAEVVSIKPTPVEGLNEVMAGGQVLYLSDDARYLFHGNLLDMEHRVNMTDIAQSSERAKILNEVPDSEKIIFRPPGEVKHVVRVFTDISCGYCTKLHEGIKGYLDAGIQVEYLAFPRGGEQSPAFAQMQSIWCSAKPTVAYEAAMMGDVPSGVPCDDPVGKHYALGDRIGVKGTPAIYTVDGVQVGGYLPAPEMLRQLEAKALVARSREQANAS